MNRNRRVARVLSWAVLLLLFAAGAARAAAQGEAKKEDRAQKRRAFVRLREILKAEPSARDVQDAALRFYKLEPDRIDSMSTAARLKGLVPEFEAGMDNSLGHNYSNTKDGLYPLLPNPAENPNPNFYKERMSGTSDSFLWRLRAVWTLDRLVFNAEQLDIKSLNSLEENLVREVTTLYFSRRRLLANLVLSPPEDEEELFYEQLRLDELTSTIDVLTGGMFAAKAWKGDLSVDR